VTQTTSGAFSSEQVDGISRIIERVNGERIGSLGEWVVNMLRIKVVNVKNKPMS
jgi:hypothetical protein